MTAQIITPDAGTVSGASQWLDAIKWDEQGLVPVIAQEAASNEVVMFAWMNRDALALTVQSGEAVYWSRSRKKLWHKGEESGHTQKVIQLRVDCDADVVLLKIEQIGGIACHTGRHSCFFQQLVAKVSLDGAGSPDSSQLEWQAVEPVLKDPQTIYK